MLTNYVKRFGYRTYGGNSWSLLTGFEQFINSSTTIYYLFDWGNGRGVIYNNQWVYQSYASLVANSYTAKCVGNFLYISSDTYFYKANTNLNIIQYSSYYGAGFRAISYDSSSGYFYITSQGQFYLNVFNMNLARVSVISMSSSYDTYGLLQYNGLLYVGSCYYLPQNVFVFQSNVLVRSFILNACSSDCIASFLVDYTGQMIIGCNTQNYLALYDSNGNYQNIKIGTTYNPFVTAVDSQGRFIVATMFELQIYY